MRQWEYKRGELLYPVMDTVEQVNAWRVEYMDWLNAFGMDGWEVMKFDFGPNSCVALMKREVMK